ncbi:MAG: hypothetical protein AAFP70_10755, partial [Calditrichota bacterium]
MNTRLAITLNLFLILLLISSSLIAQRSDKRSEKEAAMYNGAYEMVLDGKYAEATKAFDNFMAKYPRSRWADDAGFWSCFAAEKARNDKKKAYECFANFMEKFRSSSYRDDARSNMVRILKELVASGENEYRPLLQKMQKDDDEEI